LVCGQIPEESGALSGRELPRGASIDEHGSRLDRVEPEDGSRERALARAHGAGDPDKESRGDVEVEHFQRWSFGARVSKNNVTERHHSRTGRTWAGSDHALGDPGNVPGLKRGETRLPPATRRPGEAHADSR